jgi:hypothetical protein
MPESVTDRPTKSHEYLFLLTKSASYFYDAEAIKEAPSENKPWRETPGEGDKQFSLGQQRNGNLGVAATINRNKRSVWTVATAPFSDWTETVRWKHVEAGAAMARAHSVTKFKSMGSFLTYSPRFSMMNGKL